MPCLFVCFPHLLPKIPVTPLHNTIAMNLRLLLLGLGLLLSYTAFSQRLPDSRKTSYYTYIYQLNQEEAISLYESGMKVVQESYFHTLVDSVETDSLPYTRKLPVGHYLLTHVESHQLVFSLKTVDRLKMELLNNKQDLALIVHDSLGNLISDAEVFIKKKRIPFDKPTQSYRLLKSYKDGLLRIEHAGHSTFFSITQSQYRRKFSLKRLPLRIAYSFPVKYLWFPVRDIVRTIKFGNPQGWIRSLVSIFDPYHRRNYRDFEGYVVLNKPVFRPGDTLRLKAFVSRPKGKPYRKDLRLELTNSYSGTRYNKIIDTLSPQRDGAYFTEFVLHDSLNLKLDQTYSLQLLRPNLDIALSKRFKLEDYELDETTYAFRADAKKHSTGVPIAVYARGSDANELNLLDATLNLYVLAQSISAITTDSLFLPDTVWTHEQTLDPIGETKVILPDSIFPDARLNYLIKAVFTNASNERHTEQAHISYSPTSRRIDLSLQADSLVATYEWRGKPTPTQGKLLALSNGKDTLSISEIHLPAHIPVNPFVAQYLLLVDSLSTDAQVKPEGDQLSCFAYRSTDSLFVKVENPRKLAFWYHIYRKNKTLQKGKVRSLDMVLPATASQNYFVSIQGIWGGEVFEKEYKVSFSDRQLQVQFDQPSMIYPGQTTEIGVQVTDASGNPVANTDLTAYALTSKFQDASLPIVPNFSTTYKDRRLYYSFSKNGSFASNMHNRLHLNYPKWNRLTGLDSIAWFQFLYPDSGMAQFILPAKDSLTQFAPFVVQNGQPLDVHLIYLDEKLIYSREVTVVNRYTFHTLSGYHNIRLRTRNALIEMDSVFLPRGQKLIFSVEVQPFNPHARVTYMEEKWTRAEKALLTRSLMPLHYTSVDSKHALEQGNLRQLLERTASRYNRTPLAGPFYPRNLRIRSAIDPVGRSLSFESGFEYEFLPGLVKMRTNSIDHLISPILTESHQDPVLTDSLLSLEEVLELWKNKEITADRIYYYRNVYNEPRVTKKGYGRLQIDFDRRDSIMYQLLFHQEDSSFLRIYPGHEQIFHQLESGAYLLVGLRSDSSFFRIRDLNVQVNGLNYYRKKQPKAEAANAFSIQLMEQVNDRIRSKEKLEANKEKIKQEYRQSLVNNPDPKTFTEYISGRVIHESTGMSLAGVTVILEGTTSGTLTDINGKFSLFGPRYAVLRTMYIGFDTQTTVYTGEDLEIGMEAAESHLDEVVITALGYAKKKSLAAAVVTTSEMNNISGKVAGVALGAQNLFSIRGAQSVSADQKPMYIVDGVLVSEDIDLSSDKIGNLSIMDGEAASAIYGSRAMNGVILITTKEFQEAKQKEVASLTENALQVGDAGNSLRSNFHDDAFWQPNLLTDKQGKASFTVTFPDDITRWNTYALAMGPNKQSGQTQGSIKAYKELMAQLALPRFMVQGDSAFAIGKVLNYSPDTLDVTTKFQLNDLPPKSRSTSVVTAIFDTLVVRAPEQDSLTLTYSMKRSNGYFDGEKRSIPLFPQGVLETKGQFLSLEGDTTATIQFDSTTSQVKLYAQAHPIKVLLGEFRQMRNYRYLCNEQAASKLKTLLMEKEVRTLLGEKINVDREVRRLIKKLQDTQDESGLWGWWANGQYNPWISRHVLEALLQAQVKGYTVSFNRRAAVDQLMYQLESTYSSPSYKIHSLSLLRQLDAKPNFQLYLDSLNADTTLRLTEQLQIIELRQQLDLPYSLDSLEKHQQETLFGNLYWGQSGYHPYWNSYTSTLAAYRVLRTAGGEEKRLQKIRNYLFEQKKSGYWPNTYASASVLETILPDLISDTTEITPPKLRLSGAVNASITEFPYEASISPEQALSVSKTGTSPVYFTTFQQNWNPQPKPVSGDFAVKSFFLAEGDTLSDLKAAQPVTLQVVVDVDKDSDFMMIEVPIPAGCSYGKKIQSYFRQPEVHREYFKDHVSIFCEKMPKGSYRFEIELLPRYSGSYTVNPARIEQMYFPVFFGRNESKRMRVK